MLSSKPLMSPASWPDRSMPQTWPLPSSSVMRDSTKLVYMPLTAEPASDQLLPPDPSRRTRHDTASHEGGEIS